MRVGQKRENGQLRVAVFYSTRAILGSENTLGGGGTYDLAIFNLFQTISEDADVEFLHFVPKAKGRSHASNDVNKQVFEYSMSRLEHFVAYSPHSPLSKLIIKLKLLRTKKLLHREEVDLAYFCGPNNLSLALDDVPHVLTIWDLGHRDLPGFPEFRTNSDWNSREHFYANSVPRAFHVMLDSSTTGRKLKEIYGLQDANQSVIGLLPSLAIPNEMPREIAPLYLIYPAMLWPHKNHGVLLEAFAKVLQSLPDLRLVLTGHIFTEGNWIERKVKELDIASAVIHLGFIDRDRLTSLIYHSQALVMPSRLGPTNLPPLEAVMLGKPAIISNEHDASFDIFSAVTRVKGNTPCEWAAAIKTVLEGPQNYDPVQFPIEEAKQKIVSVLQDFSDSIL